MDDIGGLMLTVMARHPSTGHAPRQQYKSYVNHASTTSPPIVTPRVQYIQGNVHMHANSNVRNDHLEWGTALSYVKALFRRWFKI